MSANMKDSWWVTTSYWMQTYKEQYEAQRRNLELQRIADIEKQKLMGYYETSIYQDACTLWVRTVQQDKEIATLRNELKEKKVKKDTDLKSLIAYYYNR